MLAFASASGKGFATLSHCSTQVQSWQQVASTTRGWNPESQCTPDTEPASMSGEQVVEHTPRNFCGQIGSHKARGRYRRCRRGVWSPRSRSQTGHVRRPIAACSRHASIRLHGWESWGLHGRPSANLIYAPAIQLQARCKVSKGRLADQAHLTEQLHHIMSDLINCNQPARPPHRPAGHHAPSSSHRQPPFLFITSTEPWGACLIIPKGYRQLHQDPRQCPNCVFIRCKDIDGLGGPRAKLTTSSHARPVYRLDGL